MIAALTLLSLALAVALWRARLALRRAAALADVLRALAAAERARADAAQQRLDDARARVLRVAQSYAGPVRAMPRPTAPGGDA